MGVRMQQIASAYACSFWTTLLFKQNAVFFEESSVKNSALYIHPMSHIVLVTGWPTNYIAWKPANFRAM